MKVDGVKFHPMQLIMEAKEHSLAQLRITIRKCQKIVQTFDET